MTIPRWALTLSLPFMLVLGLSGCSSSETPADSAAANSPETSRAYADCLTSEGIDGVFVDDEGLVGISFTVEPGSGESGPTDTPIGPGPGADEAYAAAEEKCRGAVPDYHDGSDIAGPAAAAQHSAQSRAFASCARKNGLADFPDPDASAGGQLIVPAGTTKAQFLDVVTACGSAFSESATPTGPAGDGADTGTVTVSMPQFGGAYESSWSSEVMDVLFNAMQSGSATAQ